MRYIIGLCFNLVVFFGKAQNTIIILLRYAEKDTTEPNATIMTAEPPLTKAGKARAESLVTGFKVYKPDIIYSTNYTRTKATVVPLQKNIIKKL